MNRSGERWLVIGAHNPFPARNGSALRILQHLETLRAEGATTFYWGIGSRGEERQDARIVHFTPWAELSPLGKAMRAPGLILGLLIGNDPNATFLFTRKRSRDLERTVRAFRPTHLLISESFMDKYQGPISGRRWYGLWIHRVIDLHNVESNLRTQVSPGLVGKMRSNAMFEAEYWLSNMSDEVWVCSREDAATVAQRYFVSAKVVPNKVNAKLYENIHPTTNIRSFGMVGIWSYEPNGRAADTLLSVIWPEVGKNSIPILVGKAPTELMREAAGQGAVVSGEVPDVRSFLTKIRTMVIPLTEGGGTRMKVLESMAAGIPVVATAKAVEGLEVKHLEHCVICEPEEMADWILKLWDSPGLENALRENARNLVKEKYSW